MRRNQNEISHGWHTTQVLTISYIVVLCYFGKIIQDQHYVSTWLKKTDSAAASAKMKAHTQQVHSCNHESIKQVALEYLDWKHAH